MKVECVKSGKASVVGSPTLPQVTYKNGEVIDVHPKLAARLIEVGHAKEFVEPEAEEVSVRRPRRKVTRRLTGA